MEDVARRLQVGDTEEIDVQNPGRVWHNIPYYANDRCNYAWSTDWLEKLLRGPWTDEKLNLVHRIADWVSYVESQSAAAVKGMNVAIVEHNAQAIEILNPRGHFGVTKPRGHFEVTREIFELAVSSGCLIQLMRWMGDLVVGQNGYIDCKDVAHKKEKERDERGKWVREMVETWKNSEYGDIYYSIRG